MNSAPYLHVKNLTKVHAQGRFSKHVIFQLQADFKMEGAGIVAIVGPNGAGKTTLFDLIAGQDMPTSGQVICHGQDIHRVKYTQRRHVVNHHRQPHHVRKYKWQLTPEFLLEPARNDTPRIHLYDEPDMTDGTSACSSTSFANSNRKAISSSSACTLQTPCIWTSSA
ncbi:ATP-binding cassette domain-containing protein [Rhodoferax sp. UBA5149]|uniref:ATP-binding cassette domain-containing protein n=1 Tax=Rhodoferax sp. UBA5149 TaxID=1947379 RepID=UPI0025D1CFBE|nr:ATP-binding cassette domain-containing protein [Rhodoferax sp. UBA5149]